MYKSSNTLIIECLALAKIAENSAKYNDEYNFSIILNLIIEKLNSLLDLEDAKS